MPYPETAEGFMIHDQKNWQDFKKEEVRLNLSSTQCFHD